MNMGSGLKEKIFDANSSSDKVISYLMHFAGENNKYVFRGYNQDDEIYPKIIRKINDGYVWDEIALLRQFEKHGANYLRVYNGIDFLACAQHYGLPTRLVDFSYNPFVALAFALFLEKKTEKDDDYYSILYCGLNDDVFSNNILNSAVSSDISGKSFVTFSEQVETFIKYLEGNFLVEDKERLEVNVSLEKGMPIGSSKEIKKGYIFIDPFQSNQRLIVQQGLFMIPATLNKETYKKIIQDNMSLIKIHKNLRECLLNSLKFLGCDMYHLMPDLVNICHIVQMDFIEKISTKDGTKQGNF